MDRPQGLTEWTFIYFKTFLDLPEANGTLMRGHLDRGTRADAMHQAPGVTRVQCELMDYSLSYGQTMASALAVKNASSTSMAAWRAGA